MVERRKPIAVTQGVQTSPKLQQQAERMRSCPPDVHNIHNFPCIQQQNQNVNQDNNNRVVNSKQNSGVAKVYKNTRNNFIKNLKNSAVCVEVSKVQFGKLQIVQNDVCIVSVGCLSFFLRHIN